MKKYLVVSSIFYAVVGFNLGVNAQNYQSQYNDNYNPPYNQGLRAPAGYGQNQNYGTSYQESGGYNQSYNASGRDNYSTEGFTKQNADKVIPDQEIYKKIKDKIGSGWFSKGYDQVTAQVNSGTVNLQGTVDTWNDKEKLEKEIRNLDGVKRLNSVLRVKEQKPAPVDNEFPQDRANTPSDTQLNKKIRDHISNGWFKTSYKEISLDVNNGVVTVSGTIDNRDNQKDLINQIQKIEGVRYVNDNLKLKNTAK